MTYSEKLRNPKWQKKRLEILQRDNFKCVLCKDDETELHVHHQKYTKNPWDAPNKDLKTMCKNCHRFIEFLKTNNYWERDYVTDILKDGSSFICVVGYDSFYFFYENADGSFTEQNAIWVKEFEMIKNYLNG